MLAFHVKVADPVPAAVAVNMDRDGFGRRSRCRDGDGGVVGACRQSCRVHACRLVPAFVPLAGVSVSRAALSLAVQVSVPLPVLDTPHVFAAGLAAPAIPEKARLA